MELYKHNQTTGGISQVIFSYTVSDDASCDEWDWHFAMSDHAIFWTRRNSTKSISNYDPGTDFSSTQVYKVP